ncbi:SDR family oxidoreductase [Nocardiopsis sp. NRRL B-16309]|uniref:SDR family oxidoreductase n=1 Tax=Nocardiopsis sp. NRRL B-16309 TaxID=1519494 RepID=UPI0006AD963D|nr:SDR family oxidoreductase [Nocardiopsis sp. NRRL B-16309]KOX16339.1 nucleoside-diphosphate sugar epimerase [Nocardiopsis sp. NRRL B-16309]
MSVVITGATGHLGRLVVEDLLAGGLPADQITATGRDTAKLADLSAKGVSTARADFGDPASLKAAFEGADTVLLVSGSEVGQRVDQHRNAVEAAKDAGVGHIVYTSVLNAAETTLILAPEHKATEEIILGSGLTYTFLRNGWYSENYEQQLHQARETGTVLTSAGAGRVASASRSDYAAAAAAVLRDPAAHANAVHELSGDTAWDFGELAAAMGEALGRAVTVTNVTPEEHEAVLTGVGLDEGTARFVVGLDTGTREGELAATTGELSRLIGRPTTPLVETLRTLV